MKLQLDTTNKTIKIQDDIELKELIETLERLLPNELWKEFKLKVEVINNWTYPIVIDSWSPYRPYPWYYTLCNTTHLTDYQNGTTSVFNIDIEKNKL